MSLQQSLLAKISADPWDYTSRLVYADWSEEQGDDRTALFIRAQCDYAKAEKTVQRLELKRQFEGLLEEQEANWRANNSRSAYATKLKFRRGFVDGIFVNGGAMKPALLELLAASPIRAISVDGTPSPMLADLLKDPAWRDVLGRIEELEWRSGKLSTSHTESLAKSPLLTKLRSLAFWQCHYPDNGLSDLAHSPLVQRIRSISMRQSYRGSGASTWLLRGGWTDLDSIDLTLCSIESSEIRQLAKAYGARLQRLILDYCDKSMRLVETVSEAGFETLRCLALGGATIDDRSARKLTKLKSLEELHLGGVNGGDPLVELLAAEPMPSLKRLRLQSNMLSDRSLEILAGSPLLSQLEYLDLRYNNLTIPGIEKLFESKYWSGTLLTIGWNPAVSEERLARCPQPLASLCSMSPVDLS